MVPLRTLTHTMSAIVALGLSSGVANAQQGPPAVPGPIAVPGPTVSPSPLRVIGRVHAKTKFCQAIYDHGRLATTSALQGDADLDDDVHWLAGVDLDSSEIAREHGLLEFSKRYVDLGERARAAIEETKALRAVAKRAPTPEQQAALITYADALGGALHRQTLLADALGRVMMNVQQRPAITQDQRDEDLLAAAFTPRGPFEHSWDPRNRVPETLSEMAHAASIELTNRRVSETDDETRAAMSADAAFSPCNP